MAAKFSTTILFCLIAFLVFANQVAPRQMTVVPQHKEMDVRIGRMPDYWSTKLLEKPPPPPRGKVPPASPIDSHAWVEPGD